MATAARLVQLFVAFARLMLARLIFLFHTG
jgi:hypothetical protein